MFSHSFLTEIAVFGVLASLAGGTLILMILLLLLKRDCHRKLAQLARELDNTKGQYHRSLLELEARLSIQARDSSAPLDVPVEPVVPPVAEMPAKRRPLPELRTEVMEMNGNGLDASSIAARLCMRENEVRLLLKVHNTLRCVPQSE